MVFINNDKNGNKISSEQKLQTAVEYFKKNILPELKKNPSIKQKIEEKQSLSINDLTRKGYSGFLNALSRDNKVKWSELKQTLGYTNNKHKVPTTEYKFINHDKDNKPLNLEQKIKIASDFYYNKILPDLKKKSEIRKKLEAGKGIGYRDLEKYGYSKFHSALTRQGIHVKWNEFKETTNQKIKPHQKKSLTEIKNTQTEPYNISKNPKTRQKLYNDGEKKECGRCHQIKTHEEFASRKMGGKEVLFSRCKECRIDTNQIYKFRNKVNIIQNVYNGKLKGKCQMCSADIKELPALEFHHLESKLKSEKGISMSRNWEETRNK